MSQVLFFFLLADTGQHEEHHMHERVSCHSYCLTFFVDRQGARQRTTNERTFAMSQLFVVLLVGRRKIATKNNKSTTQLFMVFLCLVGRRRAQQRTTHHRHLCQLFVVSSWPPSQQTHNEKHHMQDNRRFHSCSLFSGRQAIGATKKNKRTIVRYINYSFLLAGRHRAKHKTKTTKTLYITATNCVYSWSIDKGGNKQQIPTSTC